MKMIFAMLLLGLSSCAGNKAVANQVISNGDDPRCKDFLIRLKDYPRYFKEEYDIPFEEEMLKMSFPIELENGLVLSCLETITCDKINYCITVQDSKGFVEKF